MSHYAKTIRPISIYNVKLLKLLRDINAACTRLENCLAQVVALETLAKNPSTATNVHLPIPLHRKTRL